MPNEIFSASVVKEMPKIFRATWSWRPTRKKFSCISFWKKTI